MGIRSRLKPPAGRSRWLACAALSCALLAGCARPTIVGKWRLRPSAHTGNIEWIEVFRDGTVLRHEKNGDFTDHYRTEGDKIIINDDEMVVTRLTETMMIWTEANGNRAYVFDRETDE